MTNTEILLKALKIANQKGYDTYYADVLENYKVDMGGLYLSDGYDFDSETIAIREIIFDPEFAKAYWGEEGYGVASTDGNHLVNWQYHLQQMVVEDNYLKYIEKYL